MYLGTASETWKQHQRDRDLLNSILEQAKIHYSYFAAIDLGQQKDRSAICILESAHNRKEDSRTVALRYLRPLKRKISYVDQAEAIDHLFQHKMFDIWPLTIYLDSTGLGSVVADMLEAKGLKFRRVLITSGDSVTYKNKRLRVSRVALFQNLLKYMHKPEFAISGDLKFLDDLTNELQALQQNYGSTGNLYIEGSGHDDLAISLAMAVLAYHRSGAGRPLTGVTTLY